jgi:hypothetical protein
MHENMNFVNGYVIVLQLLWAVKHYSQVKEKADKYQTIKMFRSVSGRWMKKLVLKFISGRTDTTLRQYLNQ